jgi:hypothetical protein
VARLVPISGSKDKALPPEIEDRMWKLAAPFQLPESVAEKRGPRLLSDLVVEDRELP